MRAAILTTLVLVPALRAQPNDKPDWCRALPRAEYRALHRVATRSAWFEVYEPAPNVFAIYEPHQSEEVISYLIVGERRALLFDTGMGIDDIRQVVANLTTRPVIVLNSHTHDDHVGGNYQFTTIYGMATEFSRTNAKGSTTDAQDELAPGSICGALPRGFDASIYATRPWHVARYVRDGDTVHLGRRHLEIIATPGHTPDAIALIDRSNGLLFTGDTYYPGPIWLYRRETDLDAYEVSVKRLAALAPHVRLVLGAHNAPVAPPSVLPRLVDAIHAARAGKDSVAPAGAGKAIHTVDGFSFLFRASP